MACATSPVQRATSAAQRATSAFQGIVFAVQANPLGFILIYLFQCCTNSLPGLITHKTSAKVAGATTLTIPALHLMQYIMRHCYEKSNSCRNIDPKDVHLFSDHAASPGLVLLEGLLIVVSCIILSYYFDEDSKREADGAAYNGLYQLAMSALTWLTHIQAPCARRPGEQYNIHEQMNGCMGDFRWLLFGCNTSYEDTGNGLNAKLTKEDSERANQMSQRAEENLQLYCNSN